jgi:nitroimidazol reductase NimA-like FMN-containing flavoprotein (pyridoxamine 5'-phosphate oxidase superfamily)
MKTIPAEKKQFVDDFLEAPLIARMATADKDGRPHVVPVWYGWDGQALWISSFASTRKIGELEVNPYLSVVIDVAEADGANKAVVFEGEVELIESPRDLVAEKSTWIYTRYLGEQGVLGKEPQSWIHDPLNRIIKLTPTDVFIWQM